MATFNLEKYYEIQHYLDEAKVEYDKVKNEFLRYLTCKKNYQRFLRFYALSSTPDFSRMSNCELSKPNNDSNCNLTWDSVHMYIVGNNKAVIPYQELLKFLNSDDYYADLVKEEQKQLEKEEYEQYLKLKEKYEK